MADVSSKPAKPLPAKPVAGIADTLGAAKDIIWEEAGRDLSDLSGAQVIAEFVKHLPNAPGVYRMFNAAGDVLYVGKAHSLKKRVTSYTRSGGHTNRIARMITQTTTMEFVTTHTETEALLLEANLIKRLRPRFNVLLRDDKSFPYIVLNTDHRAPGIFKHRGARARNRRYFGPFASAGAVTRTINAMQKAFLVRTCSDTAYDGRSRPCLLHQIKRCAAPCTGEISLKDYEQLTGQAMGFLSGKSRQTIANLSQQMQQASQELDFERAARYRDRISALSHIQAHQGINPGTVEEADVFAVHQDGGMTCIQVFFFRTGQNWGNRAYFPRADKSLLGPEVLGAFLSQFYDDKPCPRVVLLSVPVDEQDLLAEALSSRSGRRIKIIAPRRGEKRALSDHALANAREALGRKLADTVTQARLLEGLALVFGLASTPGRIEVYDNSHIMGTNAVGAMVVAGPDGFSKSHYRKFNIKGEDVTPGDDYAMMHEVISRRFARLKREIGIRAAQETEDGILAPWPDLILIDGGRGQLNAAFAALSELELQDQIAVVGIAKGPDRDAGRERFFTTGAAPFTLAPRDPVLYFIQRLRDEAHRFAIGSHRARRKKALTANPLDEVGGIGPARKRALLHRFGSAKAVSRAALADLAAVEGISSTIAKIIYDHFHERG